MTSSLDLIDEYLTWMRLQQYEDSTIDGRARYLRRMDDELPFGLAQALPEELSAEISKPPGKSTQAGYHDHLTGFFSWACDPADAWLDINPTEQLRRPHTHPGRPRPASDEQVRAILRTAKDPWRRCAVLAAYQGARCLEIARLVKADITEEWTTLTGKRRKVRKIPTHPYTWEIARCLPAGPVVRRVSSGQAADRAYVSIRASEHFRERLGLDVSLHELRHWFGTNALRAYPDFRTVQELMGHSNPATTALYTLIDDTQRRAAVSKLPALA